MWDFVSLIKKSSLTYPGSKPWKKYYNLPIEKKSGHFVELASKIGIFTVLGWWQTPDLQVANWGPNHPKQGIHDQSHHPSIIDDGPLLWFHFGMVTTTALWIPRRIRVPNETCQKPRWSHQKPPRIAKPYLTKSVVQTLRKISHDHHLSALSLITTRWSPENS